MANEIIPINEVEVLPQQQIESLIYTIRGVQVMLDRDLAMLYKVETKYLNRQVKRNATRFPEDFMFKLTKEEWDAIKKQVFVSYQNWASQNVTSKESEDLRCQNVTSSWGGSTQGHGDRLLDPPYKILQERRLTRAAFFVHLIRLYKHFPPPPPPLYFFTKLIRAVKT